MGHTNAVWDLAVHYQQNYLLSCSADGTCRIWNPTIKVPLVNTYSATKGMVWQYGILALCCVVWFDLV
jgi:WD40 repeat protein